MSRIPRALLAVGVIALAAQFPAPAQEMSRVPVGVESERARRILDSAEKVMKEVEQLRGKRFQSDVRKDVRTREELRRYIERRVFEEDYGEGRLERTAARLELMGLIPAGTEFRQTATDVLLSQIGGFYDPREKAFFLMVEAVEYGEQLNRMMIAHELCHALDDQYVHLDRMLGPRDGQRRTEDENFAAVSVIEGSATALMNAWMAKAVREGRVTLEDLAAANRRQVENAKVILQAPRYFTLLVANYMVGLNFITKGEGQGDLVRARSIDTGGQIYRVARQMPESMEQVLHPEKYWSDFERDAPVVVVNDDEIAAQLEAKLGLHVVERNTLGELVCAAMTTSPKRRLNLTLMARPDYWTNDAATGWGGDRLYLVSPDPTGEKMAGAGIVWVTAWDTPRDAQEFARDLRRHRASLGFAMWRGGRVVVVGFGAAARLTERTLEELAGKVQFAKDGDPWGS